MSDTFPTRWASLLLLGYSLLLGCGQTNTAYVEDSEDIAAIGAAMKDFEAAYKMYPPVNENPDAESAAPLNTDLSWRVRILPFIGEEELYARFDTRKPWDDPANEPLIGEIPDVFRPSSIEVPPGHTTYRLIAIEDGPWETLETQRRDILDGVARTIMVVGCGEERAVPWTQPELLAYESPDSLGTPPLPPTLDGDGWPIVTFDGGTDRLSPKMRENEDILRGLLTARGDEQFEQTRLDAIQAP